MLAIVSETPRSFADYPRGEPIVAGSAERLQDLMEGYYAYGWLFLLHVVLTLAVVGLSVALGKTGPIVHSGGLLVVMATMGFVSYPVNAKVGRGANWSKTGVVLASIAIALGTVCYGIIGYVVLQSLAGAKIRSLGVKRKPFGFRKKDVRARIVELRAAEGVTSAR